MNIPTMPKPNISALNNRQAIVEAMRTIFPKQCVIDKQASMRPCESDGLTAYRQIPMLVVLCRLLMVLSYR